MANSRKSPAQHLAQNLASLRQKRGLSQAQLSQLTGLPRSTLTYMESGQGNPSLQNLSKLSEGLQVPLEELLQKPTPSSQIFRASEISKTSRQQGNVHLWKLLPQNINGLDMDRFEIKPKSQFKGTPHLPYTREFLVCLSGQIEVTLENESFVLGEGDVLVFPGDQKHQYRNLSNRLSTAISVVAYAQNKF